MDEHAGQLAARGGAAEVVASVQRRHGCVLAVLATRRLRGDFGGNHYGRCDETRLEAERLDLLRALPSLSWLKDTVCH